VHLAEDTRQGFGDAAGATADFEHAHLLGIHAAADVGQVVEDVLFYGFFTRSEESLVGPLLTGRGDEVGALGAGARVPIRAHFIGSGLGRDIRGGLRQNTLRAESFIQFALHAGAIGHGSVALADDGALTSGGLALHVGEFHAECLFALQVLVELLLQALGVGRKQLAMQDEVAQAGNLQQQAIQAGHRADSAGCCCVRQCSVPKPSTRSTA
jgi:hypothetical protein